MRLLGEVLFTPGHPDPYPVYRELRQTGSVLETQFGSVALSWQTCEAILRDRRFSSVPLPDNPLARSPGGDDPLAQHRAWIRRWSIYRDPPDHTGIRALFSRVFTPRRVEGLRPYVRLLLESYLQGATDRGEVELVSEVALPLPITVLGELIGIPAPDRPRFRGWSQAILRPIGDPSPPSEAVAAAEQATHEVADFMRSLVDQRRREPEDDLVSDLVQLDHGDLSVPDEDLLANLQFLMSAGFETTVFTIGNAIKALTDHPDQLDYLRQNPNAVGQATEELLRYETPILFPNPRRATVDVELADATIPEGTTVAVLPGAANRDPDHVDEADRLDIRRETVHSLSFGSGIHFCLGAALARLEIQEALLALTHFEKLERTADVEWTPSVVFRGPQKLMLGIA